MYFTYCSTLHLNRWWKCTIRSLSLSLSLSISIQFKCALLAWQKLYICMPKQLQLGYSQVVHIWINRNKNNNNKTNDLNRIKYVVQNEWLM